MSQQVDGTAGHSQSENPPQGTGGSSGLKEVTLHRLDPCLGGTWV